MIGACSIQVRPDTPRGIIGRAGMRDLIKRVAEERDDRAFGELFAAFAPKVKTYMMRLGADAATAEELMQETLLAVWRKAGQYSAEKGSAATWIYTIARNLRIDRFRRETVWQELPSESGEIAGDETPPDEAASAHEREARVQRALAELSAEQREIVTLAYIEGLSHSELAGRLGLPLGTVKSRMRLAYQKIRPALEDLK